MKLANGKRRKPVAANNNYDDWGEAEVPYQPKELGIIDQILLVLGRWSCDLAKRATVGAIAAPPPMAAATV